MKVINHKIKEQAVLSCCKQCKKHFKPSLISSDGLCPDCESIMFEDYYQREMENEQAAQETLDNLEQ